MMRRSLVLTTALAGCALGGQTEFSTAALGPVTQGVACVAEEVQEAGWTVVQRDNDGFVRAELAGDWLEAEVVPGDGNQNHVVRVRVSNSAESRDTAEDVLANCS